MFSLMTFTKHSLYNAARMNNFYLQINFMKIHVSWIATTIHIFPSLSVKLHLIYCTCKHQKVFSTEMIYEIYTPVLRGISSVFDL